MEIGNKSKYKTKTLQFEAYMWPQKGGSEYKQRKQRDKNGKHLMGNKELASDSVLSLLT